MGCCRGGEAVGVGMLADGGDAADVYFAPAAGFLHLADLDAGHGEAVGEFITRDVHVDVLPEPAKGNFHRIPTVPLSPRGSRRE